jgi:putative transposase
MTAREANRMDDAEGRKVWYQYWDTHITSERSYFARLRYVHENAGRHGIVEVATAYPWCSAGWFEQRADSAFHRMVTSFPIDRVNVHDEFTPEPV